MAEINLSVSARKSWQEVKVKCNSIHTTRETNIKAKMSLQS